MADARLSDLPAWWTLVQAEVWIASRDASAVCDAGPPHHGRDAHGAVGWHGAYLVAKQSGEPVGPDPSEADNLLLAAARRGVIRSRGVQSSSDKPRDMNSADWAVVRIVEDRSELGAKWLVSEGGWGTFWRGVLVARDDVVREWPPFGEAPQTIPGPGPTAPTPAASGAGTQPRPVFSETALRAWYRLRCHAWPASHPPPSEADDLAAASAHFGVSVPRDPFRAIRRELAPASWKKPGPRRARA